MYKENKHVFWLLSNILLNKHVMATRRLIRQSENWDKTTIEEYQFQQLKKIITFAFSNVPYYRELFEKIKFYPQDFKNISDIKKIPFLTKNIIRERQKDLISTSFPKKYLIKETTGGSIGAPMSLYADMRVFSPVEWTYINSLWKRTGYKLNDSCVVLRGIIVRNIIPLKKYWKYSILRNRLIMSSYYMNEETLPIYINKIKKFKPKYIHAYPSVLHILAKYFEKNKIEPIKTLKGIFCGSENIYKWQRDFFEKIFKVRVYTWYGHTERCVLAGESESSTIYEIFPTHGYTEIINKDGNWASEEGELGEIVSTSFTNYAFPLIRYKTQDIAEVTNEKASKRNFKTIKNVHGRIQEFLVDKEGFLVTFLCTDEALWDIKEKVNAYQYIQNQPGKVILNIDSNTNLTIDDKKNVEKSFKEIYTTFEIEINECINIPRTKSGKFRYLIQNLPVDFSNFRS